MGAKPAERTKKPYRAKHYTAKSCKNMIGALMIYVSICQTTHF